jgi:hypothetical protein
MVDFVQLTEPDGWIVRPGPQTVQPLFDRKVVYLNEMSKLGDKPAEAVIVAGVQSYAEESGSDASKAVAVEKQKLESASSALLWPKTAWDNKSALPFVTAAVGGILVAPSIMPQQVLTSYLLTGYVIGAASQYLVVNALPVEKAETPIQKFITAKTASEKITVASPVLDLSAQPSVSLQQQIADQQAVF